MKRIGIGMVCLLLAGFVACGGSGTDGGGDGGSAAAQTAMTNSYETFGTILGDATVQTCVQSQAQQCNCPGGGTVAAVNNAFTFTGCTAVAGAAGMELEKATSTNRVFTGSLTDTGGLLGGTFTLFGDCTNATGANISADSCDGTISATCANESVTATIVTASTPASGMVVKENPFSNCSLSFGSGGGGSGGTLDAARTQLIYQVVAGAEGNALEGMMTALLTSIGTCATGTVQVNSTFACEGPEGTTPGTGTVSGTVTCTATPPATVTITSITDGRASFTGCPATVDVEGTAYAVTISTTDAVVQTTNWAVTMNGEIPTMNGGAILTFNPMTLAGDFTATAAYAKELTFVDFTPGVNNPTCTASTATVVESGQTGTCTIASTCGTCS